jgi:alpha-L-glutamate ligase-like protein
MKFFSHGILGMNARNLRYIKVKNSLEGISLADSKLKTKNFLSSRGIPFAETYVTLSSQQELKNFSLKSIASDSFVIKPNKWSGGKGILIVRREKGQYIIQDEVWTEYEIQLHMIDILHGSFSLHGSTDTVVIEELLTPWVDFLPYSKHGLADIRVIVYNYIPITAMIRMPTIYSGWKANLAQWGIGLGLNIANWQVISLFENKEIYTHKFPLEHEWLKERSIPFWDDILLFSSQVQMYTKLGYLALDWVITKNGPKLLEINARAGLEIQNVNLVPLASRLKKVEDLKILSPEKWVEVAKTLFHTDTISSWVGKKILYLEQHGIVLEREVFIVVDMAKKQSYVSKDIALLSSGNPLQILTDLNVSIILNQYEIVPEGTAKIILWTDIVQDYLINPTLHVASRVDKNDERWTKEIIDFDDEIYRLSKKVNLSSLLKPDNYFALLDQFIQAPVGFNPIFSYHFPDAFRLEHLREDIEKAREKSYRFKQSWFILADLYQEKISEVENKLGLIEAYRNENFEKISYYNTTLFWKTEKTLLASSLSKVHDIHRNINYDEDMLGRTLILDQLISLIHTYFEIHRIEKIPIVIESGNLSRMSVSYGKEVKIHISKSAIIRENEVEAILSHEIGTHFRRYLAGREQWLKLFQFGTGYYLGDEEGFAIYRSFAYLPDGYSKNAMYIKYYLLDQVDTLSFSETIELLSTIYPKKPLESLFSDAVRLKRGIIHSDTCWISGTTYQKDKIYLGGYTRVESWIANGGNPEKLFFWKIKIKDFQVLDLI